jgi:hypothetical protein
METHALGTASGEDCECVLRDPVTKHGRRREFVDDPLQARMPEAMRHVLEVCCIELCDALAGGRLRVHGPCIYYRGFQPEESLIVREDPLF